MFLISFSLLCFEESLMLFLDSFLDNGFVLFDLLAGALVRLES